MCSRFGDVTPCWTYLFFRRADFATGGAAAIAVFFLANFGFMYLVMQYTQLILGYSALQTAMAFTR